MNSSGVYLLLIELPEEREIQIGKLGCIPFQAGHYVYVGSARTGLRKRIERHLRKEKRIHWHIDYFLEHAAVVEVVTIETEKGIECKVAQFLSVEFQPIRGFGSSDCRCPSHLFYSPSLRSLREAVSK
jgi:sugar fermentation stimulation protein A